MRFTTWLEQDADKDRGDRLIIMVGGMFIGAAAGMKIAAITAVVLVALEYYEYQQSEESGREVADA